MFVTNFYQFPKEYRLWPDNPASSYEAEPTLGGHSLSLGMIFTVISKITLKGVYINIMNGVSDSIDVSIGSSYVNENFFYNYNIEESETFSTLGMNQGWNRFNFSTPIELNSSSNKYYVIWYRQLQNNDYYYYGYAGSYFNNIPIQQGNLIIPTLDEMDSFYESWPRSPGVFRANPSDETDPPLATWNNTNYWIDPIFW